MSDFDIHYLVPEGLENKALLMQFMGEINNENVRKFQSALDTLEERKNVKYVIFDFTDLAFINSQAIGYLLKLVRLSQSNQQEILLCGLTGQVAEVIELIGINHILDIYKSLGEVIKKIKES